MKKFLIFNFILVLFLQGVVFANQVSPKIYKIVPIKDKKTNAEFARTIVPQNFYVTSNIVWAKDYEQPFEIDITAKSENDNTIFYYMFPKTYSSSEIDKITKTSAQSVKIDNKLKLIKKVFYTPEDFAVNYIKEHNTEASNIKLLTERTFSQELIDYLNGEFLKKIAKIQTDLKSDLQSSMVNVTNPEVKPYIAEYSFKIDGKIYKQLFITMFTSTDIIFTKQTSYENNLTETKKLWTNTGFYTYSAEEEDFEKYFTDFIVFAADSMMNQSTLFTIEKVKKQMLVELNPSFVDLYTRQGLKNKPSELFNRYHIEKISDYSENLLVQKPDIENAKWLINLISPISCYAFIKPTTPFKQKIYVPEKYSYVYYSPLQQTVTISVNKEKINSPKITLKKQKIEYIDK